MLIHTTSRLLPMLMVCCCCPLTFADGSGAIILKAKSQRNLGQLSGVSENAFECVRANWLSAPLTLAEVVRAALCSNPRTRKAWADIAAKAAAMGIVKADSWPALTGTIIGGFGHKTIEVDDLPWDNSNIRAKNISESLEVRWKIYDFGLTRDKRLGARYALSSAISNSDDAVQAVTVDASEAFFNLLDSEAELAAARQAEVYALESLTAATFRLKAGIAVVTDQLQARTAYSDARVKVVTAEGLRRESMGRLAVVVGQDADADMQIDHGDDTVPDVAYLASIKELMTEATRNNPTLASARASANLAREDLDAARADNRPDISLLATTRTDVQRSDSMYNIPGLAALPPNNAMRDQEIQLRVTFPLFDGFAHRHRVEQARAVAAQAAIASEDTARQITLQVWSAYQGLQTDMESFEATAELLSDAAQSFEAARGRYSAGVGTVTEMLSAQSALAAANTQRLKALSSWRLSKLKLAASLGSLLP